MVLSVLEFYCQIRNCFCQFSDSVFSQFRVGFCQFSNFITRHILDSFCQFSDSIISQIWDSVRFGIVLVRLAIALVFRFMTSGFCYRRLACHFQIGEIAQYLARHSLLSDVANALYDSSALEYCPVLLEFRPRVCQISL